MLVKSLRQNTAFWVILTLVVFTMLALSAQINPAFAGECVQTVCTG